MGRTPGYTWLCSYKAPHVVSETINFPGRGNWLLIRKGGPLDGGTLITLRGRGFAFGSNYTCSFENATDLSETIDARDGLLGLSRAVTLATHSAADGSSGAPRRVFAASPAPTALPVRVSPAVLL